MAEGEAEGRWLTCGAASLAFEVPERGREERTDDALFSASFYFVVKGEEVWAWDYEARRGLEKSVLWPRDPQRYPEF